MVSEEKYQHGTAPRPESAAYVQTGDTTCTIVHIVHIVPAAPHGTVRLFRRAFGPTNGKALLLLVVHVSEASVSQST